MLITAYDPRAIADNTLRELERQPPFQLRPLNIRGEGVYVFYYTGDHDLYTEIRSPDATVPIYVGSSIHLGQRIQTHCRNLDAVWNLQRDAFLCRCLLLPRGMGLWIEQEYMVRKQPWWNQPEFSGFGNGGALRVDGNASSWDVLHPGRKSALRLKRPSEAKVALQAELALQALHDREDLVQDMFGASEPEIL